MGRLIYSVIGSLDGYINDADGDYSWAMPGEDLVAFANDQMASLGTHLYGRRMYEEMHVWETDPEAPSYSPESGRFAEEWKRADKIVYSSTMNTVLTERTRLETSFDPDAIAELKATTTMDISVEGPTLAAHALRSGLVDQIDRYVVPVTIGGGTPLFAEGLRLDLELTDQRVFEKGITLLRYRVR